MSPARTRGGAGADGADPSPRGWRQRIDDPDEALFTLAVAADLLDIDSQALRRLEVAAGLTSERPSGNQRRYSRRDLEVLSRASDLAREGTPSTAIERILDLERQVADLSAPADPGH